MTLLIKNVKVLGIERQTDEKTDVFISGDKISAIGNFPKKQADRIIEGKGMYLAPGFIDVHTTADHSLDFLNDPGQEYLLKDGITTVVAGHCGASLAPLLYGNLESIRKWADIDSVNVDWHSVHELFGKLDKMRLGVNVLTLAGHSTIRRAITGEDLREHTKGELNVFILTLERALKDGAVGFSTGLEYIHSRPTSYKELKALLRIVSSRKKLYATHLRNTKEKMSVATEEAVELTKEAGTNTLIVHFAPILGFEDEYKKSLEIIEKTSGELNLHFSASPFPSNFIPLYQMLPLWAQEGNLEIMNSVISDVSSERKLQGELFEIDPEKVFVTESPTLPFFAGKSLRELMNHYELKDQKKAMLLLMRATKLRAVLYVENLNESLLLASLFHPRALIGSHSSSAHMKKEIEIRKRGVFSEFLRIAFERGIAPGEAVKKITYFPAKKLDLKRRGEIKEGYAADVILLRDHEIRYTIVGGKVVVEEGVYSGGREGRMLRSI